MGLPYESPEECPLYSPCLCAVPSIMAPSLSHCSSEVPGALTVLCLCSEHPSSSGDP